MLLADRSRSIDGAAFMASNVTASAALSSPSDAVGQTPISRQRDSFDQTTRTETSEENGNSPHDPSADFVLETCQSSFVLDDAVEAVVELRSERLNVSLIVPMLMDRPFDVKCDTDKLFALNESVTNKRPHESEATKEFVLDNDTNAVEPECNESVVDVQ